MPFDGTSFPARREQPRRAAPGDNAVSLLIIVIAFSLLAMPVSLAGLIDIIHYVWG